MKSCDQFRPGKMFDVIIKTITWEPTPNGGRKTGLLLPKKNTIEKLSIDIIKEPNLKNVGRNW